MKLIIEKDGVKRELEAPFNLCIASDTIRDLQDQLSLILIDQERKGSGYGWVTIYPKTRTISNTKPIPWTSGSAEPIRSDMGKP